MEPNTTPWFLNSSSSPPPGYAPLKVPAYLQAIIITMYTLIIVLAVGGNLIVCYTILRVRRMRTVINFFIISLAISDILMAIFCIPFTFVANLVLNYWPFGDILCPIVTFLQTVVVLLSCFILVAISIDRYVAIIYPLRQKLTKRQAGIIIAFVWFLAFCIPLPTALYSKAHKYVDYPTAPEFCEEIWTNGTVRYTYSICILLLQYFIPLVVLAFTYGRIIFVMCIKKPPGEAVSTRDRIMAESKRKVSQWASC
ncbi:hypothetical protein SNE40_020440 [Patella caerulea]|uniref:G-protein coupled receptors family 1 profile domain-containing protein n=1 Tax=Patella caerulea TaxID=87958 RepID=A0AAN8GHQ6_PATCE